MRRIFFDTNIFIYLFEDQRGRGADVARLVERILEQDDLLLTSTLTLGELLVKPIHSGDLQLVAQYEEALHGMGIKLISFDSRAAHIFAAIRGDRSIKSPDAIQLACAASEKCDLFVTNDDSLVRKTVEGIKFITTLDRVPL